LKSLQPQSSKAVKLEFLWPLLQFISEIAFEETVTLGVVIVSCRVRASSPNTHKVYYGCAGRATQTIGADLLTLTGLVMGWSAAACLLADL